MLLVGFSVKYIPMHTLLVGDKAKKKKKNVELLIFSVNESYYSLKVPS